MCLLDGVGKLGMGSPLLAPPPPYEWKRLVASPQGSSIRARPPTPGSTSAQTCATAGGSLLPHGVFTTFQLRAACFMEIEDVSIIGNKYPDYIITCCETVIKKETWGPLFFFWP